MITAAHVTKHFGEVTAVNDISVTIRNGEVFGLIGTNGAGKSTFLRMAAGVIKPDNGKILMDEQPVYENPSVKADIFYISDDQYFLPNATPRDMAGFYQDYYASFDRVRFDEMLGNFQLKPDRRINTFSKGMKKQLSVLLGVCANTKYLFCDETFDGLDPVMRQAVKSIFAGELSERDFTPVQKDLEEMKLNIHNVQCVFQNAEEEKTALGLLDLVKAEKRGSLNNITVRGSEKEIMEKINTFSPVFAEIVPLTLEEIFISETEVVGYDIKKLIF